MQLLISTTVSVILVTCLQLPVARAQAPVRTMSRLVLEDKIRGAWAGQMIGVSYGAPTEFKSLGKILEGEIRGESLANSLAQDDLYVEMTFAHVMDTIGLDATAAQYGEALKSTKYPLWHANAGARRNLNRGIEAPRSGSPTLNIHADDIDFQIEADFIGIMCPGLPQMSNRFCERVGSVMNYGDGLYGGMFVCGMYAAAYFEDEPRRVVEAGLGCIPAQSPYARLIRDVLDWSTAEPEDWRKVWTKVEEKWNKNDPCPEGVHRAFSIDAKLNGAYIVIGLLYGQRDWQQTMEIATRCGQDSDCNPSSALGVLGAMRGFAQLPESDKAALNEIADRRFTNTDYSYNEVVESTIARALQVITLAGGKVTITNVAIPHQLPSPPEPALSNFGVPVRRIQADSADWQWVGSWSSKTGEIWDDKIAYKETSQPGDQAFLKFEGTGVALSGQLSQQGGRAEVYIDGVKAELIADAYIVPQTFDSDLWRMFDLPAGPHTLRLVVSDDADARSTGRRITIAEAIIYNNQ